MDSFTKPTSTSIKTAYQKKVTCCAFPRRLTGTARGQRQVSADGTTQIHSKTSKRSGAVSRRRVTPVTQHVLKTSLIQHTPKHLQQLSEHSTTIHLLTNSLQNHKQKHHFLCVITGFRRGVGDGLLSSGMLRHVDSLLIH